MTSLGDQRAFATPPLGILSPYHELNLNTGLIYSPPMEMHAMTQTPSRPKWRLPGEFEPQAALMLAWPHMGTDWAPCLQAIRDEYQQLMVACAHQQPLIVLKDPSDSDPLPDQLSQHRNIHIASIPFDDTWCRDFGPISLVAGQERRLLDFVFTAWDKAYQNTEDNQVNLRLCGLTQLSDWIGPSTRHPIDFVLEGGAIESNGESCLLINWFCLQKRHPSLSRAEIATALKNHLHVQQIMGIDIEPHEGDDTDGHIDTLARFISADTIVAQDVVDPKKQGLFLEQLQELSIEREDGNRVQPKIIRLPAVQHARALPLNYVNFALINGACLVPVYGLDTDAQALRILSDAMPQRKIIPVRSNTLITQFGGPHCATMHFPATSNRHGSVG